MSGPTILLVEDNPITRKLVRFTLEGRGYTVLDAPDGKTAVEQLRTHPVSLVLQDLLLPDCDGFELLGRLRALPSGAEIPILAFSGFVSKLEEARISSVGFDDVLTKPVEPSRLLQVIRTHLPGTEPQTAGFGRGHHVIVADDDPVQRKLVCFRLGRLGFRTTPAGDGQEALELARATPPDAIIADVMMPRLDGFALCVAVRKDEHLHGLPLFLVTNSYLEAADRELARNAGANAMVQRTPELEELSRVLQGAFNGLAPPPMPISVDTAAVEAERMRRVVNQLERQVTLNAGISQRAAMLAAELSVLSGISGALAHHQDTDSALRDVLAACLDAGGISVGALYLAKDGGGFRVHKLGGRADWPEGLADGFFGEPGLLAEILAARRAVAFPSSSLTGEAVARFLERSGVKSALVIPLEHKERVLGALLMVSATTDLSDADRIAFATGVANQISLALALATSFDQQRASEQQAHERAAVLRSVLDSMADGVAVVDRTGALQVSNPGVAWLQSRGPLPSSPMDWPPHFGFLSSDQRTPFPAARFPIVRALAGEIVDGVELCMPGGEGRAFTWFSVTARPLLDEHSVVTGAAAVFRDITIERATQAQLLVSDRMASVGTLAAGVAHEINNPLASVLANLDLAVLEVEKFARRFDAATEMTDLVEELRDAREGAERVRHIVRDLKLFSRSEDERREPVDVRRVLESSLRMAWNEIRHRARLVKDYSEVPLVDANESRLGQVFLNLIVNAAQAIGEGRADENEIRIRTRLAQDRVVVDVSDSGVGIPPEVMGRLFTPFFTTKPAGVGTGLGLSICQRLVTSMGGELTVESIPGQGTTFHVMLPAAAREPQPGTETPPEVPAAPRKARVLVVDDEVRICNVIARVLGSEHDVVCFTDSREALRRMLEEESVDVILCDLMMPVMTGMELYERLRDARPELARRVVFLSGGAFTQRGRAFLDEVPNPRVEKPFDAAGLKRLVAELVG